MIDHSGISVSDIDAAIVFYDAAFAPLGIAMLFEVPMEHTSGARVLGYGRERPQFWLDDGGKQTPPVHFAFTAENRAQVDEFHKAALTAGGADNGAPGIRAHYHPDYYGAFVLDLDGNNIEAASKRRGRTCSRQAFSAEKLKELTHLSRAFDELLNRAPATQAPYVGASAFATKAGIHASAILKDPATYEHVKPESVGNMRKVMVSDQGGKSNFLNELKRHGIEVAKDDPRLDTLIAVVKEREAAGYSYEAADASFELLARRTLGEVPNFFEVDSYRVGVERRHNAAGQLVNVSEAVVKLKIDGEQRMSVSEGHGPVNALDLALRKDLGKFHAEIADLELVDYKVRILNGGTEAVTRVLIESADQTAKRWWTIGVSDNIIDASFMALMESITFKLMKNRKQAGLVAAE
ncbi:(R)-citramalate synthase [Nymphon striatum]|nr:(R)-citramalate synthase [Nymphon striatum]